MQSNNTLKRQHQHHQHNTLYTTPFSTHPMPLLLHYITPAHRIPASHCHSEIHRALPGNPYALPPNFSDTQSVTRMYSPSVTRHTAHRPAGRVGHARLYSHPAHFYAPPAGQSQRGKASAEKPAPRLPSARPGRARPLHTAYIRDACG